MPLHAILRALMVALTLIALVLVAVAALRDVARDIKTCGVRTAWHYHHPQHHLDRPAPPARAIRAKMAKLASILQRFSLPSRAPQSPAPDHVVVASNEKGGFVADNNGAPLPSDELLQPGDMTFEESTSGGMGRHLGLVSTTFLMSVFF